MKPGSDDAVRFDQTTTAHALLEREMGRVHDNDVGPWLGQVAESLDARPREGVSAEQWREALNVALAGHDARLPPEIAQRAAPKLPLRPTGATSLPPGVLRWVRRPPARVPSQPAR